MAASVEGDKYEVFDRSVADIEVIELLGQYFTHYEQFHTEIEVLEVELEETVQITTTYSMPIKVDLIYRRLAKVIAEDHKFSWDFLNPEVMDINPQLPKYFSALHSLGYDEVNSIGYNEVRTRTTKENTADPSLKFRRTPVALSAARVKRTMQEQFRAARRIAAVKEQSLETWEDNTLRVANTVICKTCVFKELCASDLNGYPRDVLLSSMYKKREER